MARGEGRLKLSSTSVRPRGAIRYPSGWLVTIIPTEAVYSIAEN